MLVGNDRDETDGFTMSLIKLLGLWYQDPIADGTVYYGAGLSYGFTAVFSSGTDYGGSGMQGHLIAGYEAFRSSTIRGFAQFEATLPFYKSHASGSDSNTRYSPSVMATFGIGWGRSNVVRVVND